MSIFTIDMSSPLPSGFTACVGRPNSGGHGGPNWYNAFGMDFGAPVGTQVFASFDGHITRYNRHDPNSDNSKEYGAQIFIRAQSDPTTPTYGDDKMGGYNTHLRDVPDAIALGAHVSQGDLLGTIFVAGGAGPHVHWALVEIIGGAPGGQYVGVDLCQNFCDISNSSDTISVTFLQSGDPPTTS